jgi:hypothetical protein
MFPSFLVQSEDVASTSTQRFKSSALQYNVVYAGAMSMWGIPINRHVYEDFAAELTSRLYWELIESGEVGDISLKFLPFSYTIEITPSCNRKSK